jgi:hypothetical protein
MVERRSLCLTGKVWRHLMIASTHDDSHAWTEGHGDDGNGIR